MFFLLGSDRNSGKASPTFGHARQIFLRLYRPYKESISKAMNNDDLNLHSVTKLSGWLCCWLIGKLKHIVRLVRPDL